jgi:hypothetical protein
MIKEVDMIKGRVIEMKRVTVKTADIGNSRDSVKKTDNEKC